MYAKWIHPKKIVIHEGDILRHAGKITVYPIERDYLLAGYYPIILAEGQSIDNESNIYYIKDKAIYILTEEDE